jgi:uncharacterized protein
MTAVTLRGRAGAPRPGLAALVAAGAALLPLWVAVFAAGFAFAFAPQASAQDPVPVPKLERRVTDLTGTLTPQQIETLDRKLAAFEQKKGSQIAVLMVPSTRPEAIEQYAIRVADAWKVGRAKVDDGLILVIAKNDQRLRLEVGYGLEGVVPDAIAKRVIRETIAPHFLTGDFYGGIVDGTDRLMRLVDGEPLPPPAPPRGQPQGGEPFETYLVILLVFTVIVGGILTRILGRFFGATATGGIAGFLALAIAGTLLAAIAAGVLAFFFSLLFGGAGGVVSRGRRGGGWTTGPVGGWGGGSWGGRGGGGWSGGGWSGGGGGFGGGGASGSWGD